MQSLSLLGGHHLEDALQSGSQYSVRVVGLISHGREAWQLSPGF